MTKALDNLPIEKVVAALIYESLSGHLIWKFRPEMSPSWNARFSGKRAGTTRCGDYVWVGLHGRRFPAHRIAWAIVTGSWPAGEVDHRNLIRSDNRWFNLRLSDHSQNCSNKPYQSNNKSGFKGVCFCRLTQKWMAQINYAGKHVYLGRANTPEGAYAMYVAAAQKHHGEFINLKSRTS